jgi:hypothetical protein
MGSLAVLHRASYSGIEIIRSLPALSESDYTIADIFNTRHLGPLYCKLDL